MTTTIDDATFCAAALSHLAYEEFTLDLEDRIKAACGAVAVHYVVNGPSHAFFAAGDHEVFVAFRGTGIRDRISLGTYVRIWFQLHREGPGRVHSRYVRALDRVWQFGIRPGLDEFAEDKAVVFCGHSLGGALAVLAAARYASEVPDAASRCRVVTFGCPRVGDKSYARRYPVRVDRWVNGSDIIQYIPPPLPFYHFGSKHHIVRGAVRHPDSTASEFACSMRALVPGKSAFKRMIVDHHSWQYLKAMSALRGIKGNDDPADN